ncbi:MAG: peptidase M14, partial [Pseudomonadota bacterium]
MRLLPLFLLVLAMPSFADDRDIQVEMFPADVTYDPAIPTPESFLGFKLGVQPVRHHQMVEYITMVAEQSPRLSVEVIGYSHERRPILFVVATSEENHA